jgi:hypothetical protein
LVPLILFVMLAVAEVLVSGTYPCCEEHPR